jgi:hypothetical protein
MLEALETAPATRENACPTYRLPYSPATPIGKGAEQVAQEALDSYKR